MPLTKCPECDHEISDKAVHCVSCGHPVETTNQVPGPWAAVTRAKTPINVFALAMMAGASVFGYSATKVEGTDALKAFTYSLHTFLAVVGMFFLTLLFCRSAIYHPNELSDAQAKLGQDRPGIAAGVIGLIFVAYGLYQAFATLSH
jgi:hypothetical protein